MSLSGIEKDKPYVYFFPIFTVATFAVFLDMVSIVLDEAIVGNMFDDTAFGALNLLEPYSRLENFLSYLIYMNLFNIPLLFFQDDFLHKQVEPYHLQQVRDISFQSIFS